MNDYLLEFYLYLMREMMQGFTNEECFFSVSAHVMDRLVFTLQRAQGLQLTGLLVNYPRNPSFLKEGGGGFLSQKIPPRLPLKREGFRYIVKEYEQSHSFTQHG